MNQHLPVFKRKQDFQSTLKSWLPLETCFEPFSFTCPWYHTLIIPEASCPDVVPVGVAPSASKSLPLTSTFLWQPSFRIMPTSPSTRADLMTSWLPSVMHKPFPCAPLAPSAMILAHVIWVVSCRKHSLYMLCSKCSLLTKAPFFHYLKYGLVLWLTWSSRMLKKASVLVSS